MVNQKNPDEQVTPMERMLGVSKEQEEEKKKLPADPRFEDLNSGVANLSRRVKVIEGRYANIRKKTQVTDQNLLEWKQTLQREIDSLNQDITDLKRNLNEVAQKIEGMLQEVGKTASKYDIRVLEKYIDFWEPMAFCTAEDVKEIVRKYNEKL